MNDYQRQPSGCLSFFMGIGLAALIWMLVPISVPGAIVPGAIVRQSFCANHEGTASVTGSMFDLAMKTRGVMACKDGSVRWVDWGNK